jgi:hypothetical protein
MQVLQCKTSGAGSPGPLMSQMLLVALPSLIVHFQAVGRAPNLICIVSCLGLHFEKEDWPNDRVEPMRSYRDRGGGRTGAGSWRSWSRRAIGRQNRMLSDTSTLQSFFHCVRDQGLSTARRFVREELIGWRTTCRGCCCCQGRLIEVEGNRLGGLKKRRNTQDPQHCAVQF